MTEGKPLGEPEGVQRLAGPRSLCFIQERDPWDKANLSKSTCASDSEMTVTFEGLLVWLCDTEMNFLESQVRLYVLKIFYPWNKNAAVYVSGCDSI